MQKALMEGEEGPSPPIHNAPLLWSSHSRRDTPILMEEEVS